jgi:hypothetical protein
MIENIDEDIVDLHTPVSLGYIRYSLRYSRKYLKCCDG